MSRNVTAAVGYAWSKDSILSRACGPRQPTLQRRQSSSADALDLGTAGGELVLEPLEAAVEVIDAIDHGVAVGRERGNHQRHRGAQVGRHHGRALEPRNALDGRGLTVEMDARAEAGKLLHMHEAVL